MQKPCLLYQTDHAGLIVNKVKCNTAILFSRLTNVDKYKIIKKKFLGSYGRTTPLREVCGFFLMISAVHPWRAAANFTVNNFEVHWMKEPVFPVDSLPNPGNTFLSIFHSFSLSLHRRLTDGPV